MKSGNNPLRTYARKIPPLTHKRGCFQDGRTPRLKENVLPMQLRHYRLSFRVIKEGLQDKTLTFMSGGGPKLKILEREKQKPFVGP